MEELEEALSGAIAATVSLGLFYPIEVLRVRVQTQTEASQQSNSHDVVARLKSLVTQIRQILLDRGFGLRLSHTMLTTLSYYFIYRQLARLLSGTNNKRSAGTNAVASNLSSMITVCMFVPLDAIIMQSPVQIGNNSSHPSSSSSWSFSSILSKYKGITSALALCSNPTIHYAVFDLLKLLAINRRRVLEGQTQISHNELDAHKLIVHESFLIGLVSKAIATLVTFPILRAKVMIMTNTDVSVALSPPPLPCPPIPTAGASVQEEEPVAATAAGTFSSSSSSAAAATAAASTTTTTTSTTTGEATIFSPLSDIKRLICLLYTIAKVQGLSGLYRGLFIHFLHTTIRGALSMSLKEEIAKLLNFIVVIARRRRAMMMER